MWKEGAAKDAAEGAAKDVPCASAMGDENGSLFQANRVSLLVVTPDELEEHADGLWNFDAMFSEFEIEKHAAGCDLDGMWIHRVFVQMDKRQTIHEMRAHFRKFGVESFKRTGMIRFIVFNYGSDWVEVVNAPQGGNAEGLEKAKQMLEEVVFEEAAKNADQAAKVVLCELARYDKEDELLSQIDFSVLFVLIGPFKQLISKKVKLIW